MPVDGPPASTPKTTIPSRQSRREAPRSSSEPLGTAHASESPPGAAPRREEREAKDAAMSPAPEVVRVDQVARMLGQIGYRRLKHLMLEAMRELRSTQMLEDDNGKNAEDRDANDDGRNNDEVKLARVMGLLREMEKISDVLGQELGVGPASESEEVAVAARLEGLQLEKEATQREAAERWDV